MPLITQFDDLPDLFIIDLFSYLTSIDILWAFANLNNRLRKLVNERGFFRHINLSSVRLSKFNTLLTLIPLNQIESLVIDIGASTLQVPRWPNLPSLTTLRLYGLRDYEDATDFILRHSTTLVHLTLGTDNRYMSLGFVGHTSRPRGRFHRLVENILPHMTSLRSLDLGQDTGIGLTNLRITTIRSSLIYLRVSMLDIPHLCNLMSVKALCTTLEQLHVTWRSQVAPNITGIPRGLDLSPMMNLHTFTLVQSIITNSRTPWSTIESLTAPNVMPVLRRVNLAIFIRVDDLDRINGSLLFTDDRQIDVQFAFIVENDPLGVQLSHEIPHGSRFHPRQVVGVSCIVSWFSEKYKRSIDLNCQFDVHPFKRDVWYTLPWAFEQLFDFAEPFEYITKTEVFELPLSDTSIVNPSRIHTLNISQNAFPPIISMPYVVRLNRIDTVHLSFHDWPIGLNLPALRHVTLTNNIIALKTFASFPTSIRSIEIQFRPYMPNFTADDWSVLRSLSALPMLNSLHILFDEISSGLDKLSCQIIAEAVPMLVHFGIYFRNRTGHCGCHCINQCIKGPPTPFNYDIIDPTVIIDYPDMVLLNSLFTMYHDTIEEIHRHILRLSFHTKPLIVVEEGGYGLDIWL